MPERSAPSQEFDELWRAFFMGEGVPIHKMRKTFQLLPSGPRCKICLSPFHGPGGVLMRAIGRGPARMNPTICDVCERLAEKHPGGAEVPMSLLFADIRGSTSLAATLGTARFSKLIARFYDAVTDELVKANGLIDRLIGDEVIALFVPVLAGDKHAEAALQGAQAILKATGHADSQGPWVPVGVGIHTGMAFIGSVGSSGVNDITALGDDVNLTARLASLASAGEILLTEAMREATGLPTDGLEPRRLEVKGRTEPVDVWVIDVGTQGVGRSREVADASTATHL